MKSKFLGVVLLAVLCGCAANHQALLNGRTLEGALVCLDNRDNIPAIVKKFFNTRDLTTEEGKTDYLLDRIRNSKLIFVRNKVEYDSASAASFMRWKLNRWQKKGLKITTAQDFITQIASGSKMSGQPYTIILRDGSRHNLQPVLQNELDALEYCLKQYPSDKGTGINNQPRTGSAPVKNEETAHLPA